MNSNVVKMSMQKVAGALKKAGFDQVKGNDYYGTGFQVRQGSNGEVEVIVRGRASYSHRVDYRKRLADFAEVLLLAGMDAVLTERTYGAREVELAVWAEGAERKIYGTVLTAHECRMKGHDADVRYRKDQVQSRLDKANEELAKAQAAVDALKLELEQTV